MGRFGSIEAAAKALGVTTGALYPYIDPKGTKQAAGKPLTMPGAAMLSKLAAFGCDIHWLVTGQVNLVRENQGKKTVPSDLPAMPTDDDSTVKSDRAQEHERMIGFLDSLGIDSYDRLRRFFDPEAILADIVAMFVARFRPPNGH